MINIKAVNWVDILSVILLITGMILTFISPSKVMFYIICVLSGILFSMLLHKTRNTVQFKYYIIASAYLIGLLIGNLVRSYGNIIWPIILFILGIVINYKKLLKA